MDLNGFEFPNENTVYLKNENTLIIPKGTTIVKSADHRLLFPSTIVMDLETLKTFDSNSSDISIRRLQLIKINVPTSPVDYGETTYNFFLNSAYTYNPYTAFEFNMIIFMLRVLLIYEFEDDIPEKFIYEQAIGKAAFVSRIIHTIGTLNGYLLNTFCLWLATLILLDKSRFMKLKFLFDITPLDAQRYTNATLFEHIFYLLNDKDIVSLDPQRLPEFIENVCALNLERRYFEFLLKTYNEIERYDVCIILEKRLGLFEPEKITDKFQL